MAKTAATTEIERLRRELSEALEQQTATSQVLAAISRSPFELEKTLQTIVEQGSSLCRADTGRIFLIEGQMLRERVRPGGVESSSTVPIDRRTLVGRAVLDARTQHAPDIRLEPEIAFRDPPLTRLAVPIASAGTVLGVLNFHRAEVAPFSPAQIALTETFADQAAIAIENVKLLNETKEALERQTAIAEILRVISSSPTDVGPVLDAIAENAMRFCGAEDAVVMLPEGDQLRVAAHRGPVPVAPDLTYPIDGTSMNGRAFVEARVIHTDDLQAAAAEFPRGSEQARTADYHAALVAPLLRKGVAIGAISLRRFEKRPFTDRQIDLLQTFADQAAIAIENVRLFNETKEALDQQTAAAEVLEVISRSTGDLSPVFDKVLDKVLVLGEAHNASLLLRDGERYRGARSAGYTPEEAALARANLERRGSLIAPGRETLTGRVALERRTVQIIDPLADADYASEVALSKERWPGTQQGTHLGVPLIRDREVIGVLIARRRDVRPFAERQIALLETFARQAAIAIESARLFNETKEALEQQTATAEVLDVISRSTTDLAPVFQTIAEKALRLCEGDNASILHREGEVYRWVANAGFSPDESAAVERAGPLPIRPGRGSLTGRVLLQRRPVQIVDSAADPEYDLTLQYATPEALEDDVPSSQSLLGVPMLRADDPIGVIIVRRKRVRPFSDKQIALVDMFAAQAVIAIENVRLFNETKEALARQTAIAGVLRVISSSPADISPVLSTIADSAARYCGAEDARVLLRRGDKLAVMAHFGAMPATLGTLIDLEGTVSGRAVRELRPVHQERTPDLSDQLTERTMLAAPLMREGVAIGTIVLRRAESGPFSDKQVELLQAFADQAVIAIENVRLFNETKESLERQRTTSEFLKVTSRCLRISGQSSTRCAPGCLPPPSGWRSLRRASSGASSSAPDQSRSEPPVAGRPSGCGRARNGARGPTSARRDSLPAVPRLPLLLSAAPRVSRGPPSGQGK